MSPTKSTTKSLTALALPLVISFTFRFLFTVVDTVYAAAIKEQDPDAVAAIGLFIPVQTVFIALWVGLSAGFTASLSQAFGHRDEARVQGLKRAMRLINLGLVPLVLFLALLLYLAIPHMGLEPGLSRSFETYALVLIVGMPFSGFLSIYPDSIVKAHHDTVSTMKAGICSTLTNVTLNTVFVFAFGWGLLGIALATILSRYAGLAYAAWRATVLERRRLEKAWDRGSTPWPGPLRSILSLAVPGGLTYLLVFMEEALIARLLIQLPDSTVALASYAVYSRLLALATMPAIAVGVAVLPFVARMVPEGRTAQVRHDLRQSTFYAVGLGLLLSLPAGWLFAGPLAQFLIPGAAEKAGTGVVRYLQLLPLAALAPLPFLILRPVFEAVQRPGLGVRIAFIKSLGLAMPLVLLGWFLSHRLGLDSLLGILLGSITATFLASGLAIYCSRRVLLHAGEDSSHPPRDMG